MRRPEPASGTEKQRSEPSPDRQHLELTERGEGGAAQALANDDRSAWLQASIDSRRKVLYSCIGGTPRFPSPVRTTRSNKPVNLELPENTVTLPPPARYWVINPSVQKLTPGLFRLGTDFGNGSRDALHFQRDLHAGDYRTEKQRVLAAHPERLCRLKDVRSLRLQQVVASWMATTFAREHAAPLWSESRDFHDLTLSIQEDFALLQVDERGVDRLILLSVCFPSGWQPEHLLGRDFEFVHAPIPEFENIAQKRGRLVEAMTTRGPYVRFVWTVTADARLDHHPEHSPRDAWTSASSGYVRVERQVTVPFPGEAGCLFLIRTYNYAFSDLRPAERHNLRTALTGMSPALLAYKGLTPYVPAILARLT